mmetsp:Transcript_57692/g.137290  ORF Transcript_57692/g.137290 Transcript_57692/m.137290 type:complete len:331 (-) Transcript_57692:325-1317(-)
MSALLERDRSRSDVKMPISSGTCRRWLALMAMDLSAIMRSRSSGKVCKPSSERSSRPDVFPWWIRSRYRQIPRVPCFMISRGGDTRGFLSTLSVVSDESERASVGRNLILLLVRSRWARLASLPTMGCSSARLLFATFRYVNAERYRIAGGSASILLFCMWSLVTDDMIAMLSGTVTMALCETSSSRSPGTLIASTGNDSSPISIRFTFPEVLPSRIFRRYSMMKAVPLDVISFFGYSIESENSSSDRFRSWPISGGSISNGLSMMLRCESFVSDPIHGGSTVMPLPRIDILVRFVMNSISGGIDVSKLLPIESVVSECMFAKSSGRSVS